MSKGREPKEIKNQPTYVTLKSNLTCDIDMDVVLTLESGINAILRGQQQRASSVIVIRRRSVRACSVAHYILHVIQWRVEFSSYFVVPVTRFLSATSFSPSLPCCSFSTDTFSVRSVPLFVSLCVGANGWVAPLCQLWGCYSM